MGCFRLDAKYKWHLELLDRPGAEQLPSGCRFVLEVTAETRDESMALCERLQGVREAL